MANDSGLVRIRNSEVDLFADCRRHHHLQYVRGLTRVSIGRRMPASGQRDAGSAAHAGLAVLHRGGTVEAAQRFIDQQIETWARVVRENNIKAD